MDKTILNRYLKDTQDFVRYVESVITEVEAKSIQIEKDRELIIKERADIIKKSNLLLAQVDSMRIDRDNALQQVREAEKLKSEADDELKKASLMKDEVDRKAGELIRKEKQLIIMGKKFANLSYLVKLKDVLETKEAFIKREQDLLYDRQKVVEAKEDNLHKEEERIKRLQNG